MWTALSPGENKHQRSLILSVITFHDVDDDDEDDDDVDDDDGHLEMEVLGMEMALAEPAEGAAMTYSRSNEPCFSLALLPFFSFLRRCFFLFTPILLPSLPWGSPSYPRFTTFLPQKISEECKTDLTSQYETLFLCFGVFGFCLTTVVIFYFLTFHEPFLLDPGVSGVRSMGPVVSN